MSQCSEYTEHQLHKKITLLAENESDQRFRLVAAREDALGEAVEGAEHLLHLAQAFEGNARGSVSAAASASRTLSMRGSSNSRLLRSRMMEKSICQESGSQT